MAPCPSNSEMHPLRSVLWALAWPGSSAHALGACVCTCLQAVPLFGIKRKPCTETTVIMF